MLGYDNGVVCLYGDILTEILITHDLFVIDIVDFLFSVFIPKQYNFFFGCPIRKPSGDGKCLQNGQTFNERVFTGFFDLAQNIKLLAFRFFDGDRYNGISNLSL